MGDEFSESYKARVLIAAPGSSLVSPARAGCSVPEGTEEVFRQEGEEDNDDRLSCDLCGEPADYSDDEHALCSRHYRKTKQGEIVW